MFKKVFGENLDILRDFLGAVLDLPAEEYKDLTVLDPNLERAYFDDKLGILDAFLQCNDEGGFYERSANKPGY
ncbi:MAG: Rpn family recombination-promoting nuclease/putative transposase [Deltaproteobacteria bacterium]|nr:Rpn family recombination-promoting nuclease/putative transposase [Deltaproteobacteria bacterium]